MRRHAVLNALAVLVCGMLPVGSYLLWYFNQYEFYQSWESPDQKYTVTVWGHPRLYAMPGQGSDAPGTVVLTDSSGKEFRSTTLEMVQLATEPRWEDRRVSMKLVYDWELE